MVIQLKPGDEISQRQIILRLAELQFTRNDTELQRATYPDIAPVVLPVPPDEAFRKVDAVAMGMGWDVVARAPTDGRIEAVATSEWFGFRDDIVVRIRPDGTGSKVDIRSKSRDGESDLGVNARRIREFIARLKAT